MGINSYLAGVGYRVRGRGHVEVRWSRIFLDAEFASLGAGAVDVGGDYVSIAYRYGGL